ncbi:alpha/beta fold hydrolase [Rhodococcus sp. IEGM 1408]|uniref:alpha/beta fold hydrolase n=1 Tax=Rhodococcus sp. IEGM 1408 TaxID=3082220 RepID=UPI00295445EB|nr:alpha/beta fold hydrolase [Rhodococcus sp. IEGM 1408]MDV8000158.1 alpha/beta fold hydrolase [Rhodococcus sp. IEGM 1408]
MQKTMLHGRELAYREAGAGEGKPTLLLIHGMAGSSRTWRELIPRLESNFHIIAPDLPGHGESSLDFDDYSLGAMASALRDLLVVKGIKRCTVAGQSLGGGVALQFVYQYPDFCERIVLIGSGGLGKEVNWILRLLAVPGAELLLSAGAAPFLVSAGDKARGFFSGKGVRAVALEEPWAAYESLGRSGHRRTFFKTLRAVVDNKGQAVSANNRLHLAGQLPFQLIWGDRDPIIPVSHGHTTHDAIPGSRLAIVEGTGHYPHVEDPAAVERILREFMEVTEPGLIDHETLSGFVTAGDDQDSALRDS